MSMINNTIIAADETNWNSACGSLAQLYICIGKAWNESNILFGVFINMAGIPITTNGAVSPNALDKANMVPVNIPGIEAGNTTFLIVCHLVLPKPKEASLIDEGTDFSAS